MSFIVPSVEPLTAAQKRLLTLVESAPGLTSQQIARRLGLTAKSVAGSLGQFKHDGLVFVERTRPGTMQGCRWYLMPVQEEPDEPDADDPPPGVIREMAVVLRRTP